MGMNLQLLGLRAIPRIAEKFNIEPKDFLTWTDLYGATPEEFQKACDKCGNVLSHLYEKQHVSWWDFYLNSDISIERLAVARDIGLKRNDTVLDVGCGRGYFTAAAATRSKKVIGLDLMNGGGRFGWWNNFKQTVAELGLRFKVSGVKTDAQTIALR